MKKNKEVKIGKEEKQNSLALAPEISFRGRKFEGYIIRKFDNRITIEFERVKFVKKYERYAKFKTKIHARLLPQFKDAVKLGDYVQIAECRPLSKIMHHIFVKKIRDADVKQKIPEVKEENAK
ncbi:30S ribosomal protein S17 [Candidatus Pacearchaeota archaeon]|nr:30S ribosomal protein S17P [uncultured archaeon]MBS3099953.1 30S ribosomal protein S17 [Candidatus Pacearchaeota archaeon]